MHEIDRLKEDLIESGKFGRSSPNRIERYDQLDPQKGITRPTGTQEDKKIRDYAIERMVEAGLDVKIDKIGNIFGRKEGSKIGKGTIMCGSHLDSVINGGMFDGALGVFGAIEAIRRINDEGFENERPLEVVAFTGEEGSAFKQTLLGSSVLIGKTKLKDALSMKNDRGITLGEALENIGYKGVFQRNLDDVKYMVELHIEQGPVLYSAKVPIGIVENIPGIAWMMVTLLGQENHAGSTPMKMRKDALVASTDIISFVSKRAIELVEKLGSSTVGTVGKLNVFPNVPNVIPGKVELWIDIRDVAQENIEKLKDEILKFINGLEEKYGVTANVQVPFVHTPVRLSLEVANIIEESSNRVGIRTKRMNSGAAHDSQNMAESAKTGMIFVPSVDGVSHAPLEWTNWEDIEKGTQVLTQTLKNLSGL